jgi:hypothetical protein
LEIEEAHNVETAVSIFLDQTADTLLKVVVALTDILRHKDRLAFLFSLQADAVFLGLVRPYPRPAGYSSVLVTVRRGATVLF